MFFSLPVLMYHSISRFNHGLCVSAELFDDHCRELAKAGWRGIPLGEAEDYFLRKRSLPRKSCLLTFDDGYLDNYVHAEPILRQHGHHGVLFPVAECLGRAGEPLRPNRDQIAADAARAAELPDLDTRPKMLRSGRFAQRILFCNWSEVKHMHHDGHMAAAPHSLRHDRVVAGLSFTRLSVPKRWHSFFSVPPYEMPVGFPVFRLQHAFAGPGYRLEPELFELVRATVPQELGEARVFLNNEKNRASVRAAINRLPRLGVLESEAEYRTRMFQDFSACRDIFARELGAPPVSFCWPWGTYNKIAVEEARNAGFRLFFTTRRGPNLPGMPLAVRRMRIRAVSAEQLLRNMRLASFTVLEAAYGWLRRIGE